MRAGRRQPIARTLGARPLGDGRTRFRVWAPRARRVEVILPGRRERVLRLRRGERGYHTGLARDAGPGTRYLLRLDGGESLPDPASRRQPEGVHGPSAVVDPVFRWTDSGWTGIALEEHVFYELHVGAFTNEGTFDAVIPHLAGLRALGVTALELMPVASFPGARNWGYDGVFPFAAQERYGGPDGLRRLVNAAHRHRLAVVLDVVYNHLGPEGNHLARFGPYFTSRYRTPWGDAVNFDGPGSDEVRRYFVESALAWVEECHLDALRLDAVHCILDESATPFLAQLADAVHAAGRRAGRRVHLFPESEANDPRLVRPRAAGGLGLDAVWSDDFHHALHALVTGERQGYYRDFGGLEDLARAWRDGFAYAGRYSPFRERHHGARPDDLPGAAFVVCAQNHDQVGNRMLGERLSRLVPREAAKTATACALLSPFLPLLFMGEEYGETAPFLYFVHHGDPDLVAAVRRGRRQEFARFDWQGEPPDPQAEETFHRSRLDHASKRRAPQRAILAFTRECLRLRRELGPLAALDRKAVEVAADEKRRLLVVRRRAGSEACLTFFSFSPRPVSARVGAAAGRWRRRLHSAQRRWAGPGGLSPATIEATRGELRITVAPHATVVYHQSEEQGRKRTDPPQREEA